MKVKHIKGKIKSILNSYYLHYELKSYIDSKNEEKHYSTSIIEIIELAKLANISNIELLEISAKIQEMRNKKEYADKRKYEINRISLQQSRSIIKRDNKDYYKVTSNVPQNSIRYPSKKRNIRCWRNFYALFPHRAELDNFDGNTSDRMKK